MTTDPAANQPEITPHHTFISEIFHHLSQPLTALHCSLELALDRDITAEQLRASLQTALESIECFRQRFVLVRALAHANEAGDLSQPTDLVELFTDLRNDMVPLFETAGVRLELQARSQQILARGNRPRLLQSTFCFLEHLLRYTRQGGTIAIGLSEAGKGALVTIRGDSALPEPQEELDRTPYSCEIEMVRRSYHAAGGDFVLVSHDSASSVWRGTLNLF